MADGKEELVARWLPYYAGLARRLAPSCGLDPDEAESEAGLILTLAMQNWNPELCSLKTYLHARVRLRLIDRARQLGGRSRSGRPRRPEARLMTDLAEEADARESGHGRLEDALFRSREPWPGSRLEQEDAVRELLRGLSADERFVLRRAAEGQPMREIGRALGVSESRASQIRLGAERWLRERESERATMERASCTR